MPPRNVASRVAGFARCVWCGQRYVRFVVGITPAIAYPVVFYVVLVAMVWVGVNARRRAPA